jgi:hypothetical protein
MADTDLLRKNDQASDRFDVPREVDFAFESAERENAEDFAEFVNEKLYGVAKVTQLDEGDSELLFSFRCQSLSISSALFPASCYA